MIISEPLPLFDQEFHLPIEEREQFDMEGKVEEEQGEEGEIE
jgi:hypothetical protein